MPDLALYLARQGLRQETLPGSTTPIGVGYASGTEPDPEEAALIAHAPAEVQLPNWQETSRSTVHTVTVKLTGYPLMRIEPTTMASNAAGTAAQFTPQRMRLVVRRRGRRVELISVRITGEHAVRQAESLGQIGRAMPVDLRASEWSTALAAIAVKIIIGIQGGAPMGGDGKEDAGTKDAREELERTIAEEEARRGQ